MEINSSLTIISPFSSRGASSRYGCVHARRSGKTTLRPVIFFAITSSLKFPRIFYPISMKCLITLVPMECYQVYVDFVIVVNHQILVQIHLSYARRKDISNENKILFYIFDITTNNFIDEFIVPFNLNIGHFGVYRYFFFRW